MASPFITNEIKFQYLELPEAVPRGSVWLHPGWQLPPAVRRGPWASCWPPVSLVPHRDWGNLGNSVELTRVAGYQGPLKADRLRKKS